ncbi:MAG: hypothetical protein V4550_08805 [Gemmatimonadota bacterium]
MMRTEETEAYRDWINSVKDLGARARIQMRVDHSAGVRPETAFLARIAKDVIPHERLCENSIFEQNTPTENHSLHHESAAESKYGGKISVAPRAEGVFTQSRERSECRDLLYG